VKVDKAPTTKPKSSRPKTRRRPRTLHNFELIYRGSFEAFDDIEAVLAKPGREDIFLGWQGGEYHLGFSREAPSFRDALVSAIVEVECLGLGLELVDMELMDD
jgi:hypothetical protein